MPKKPQGVSQLRSEVARSATLLAVAGIASAVATLSVTTVAVAAVTVTTAPAGERSSLSVAFAHHAPGGSVGSLLLDVRCGDDLSGQMKPFSQVVQALNIFFSAGQSLGFRNCVPRG